MIDMLKSIGIAKGSPFAPDDDAARILTDAAADGRTWLDGQYRRFFADPFFPDTGWALLASTELLQAAAVGYAAADSYPVEPGPEAAMLDTHQGNGHLCFQDRPSSAPGPLSSARVPTSDTLGAADRQPIDLSGGNGEPVPPFLMERSPPHRASADAVGLGGVAKCWSHSCRRTGAVRVMLHPLSANSAPRGSAISGMPPLPGAPLNAEDLPKARLTVSSLPGRTRGGFRAGSARMRAVLLSRWFCPTASCRTAPLVCTAPVTFYEGTPPRRRWESTTPVS